MSIKVSGGGGGGGGASYPDVTGDGLTPGGLIVQGQITGSPGASTPQAGDILTLGDFQNASAFVTVEATGRLNLSHDSGGNDATAAAVTQQGMRAGNTTLPAMRVERAVDSTGHIQSAVFQVWEDVSTTADLLTCDNPTNTRFRVGNAGGIGVFGHAAPSAQVVLATGAGHTVDDVITLLQSYGLCKQS